MGFTLYVPDDIAEPFLVDAGGRQNDAKESCLEVLEENAPEAE